jgi:hypothetical protein
MAHELPVLNSRIGNLGATKEPDIDVSFEALLGDVTLPRGGWPSCANSNIISQSRMTSNQRCAIVPNSPESHASRPHSWIRLTELGTAVGSWRFHLDAHQDVCVPACRPVVIVQRQSKSAFSKLC